MRSMHRLYCAILSVSAALVATTTIATAQGVPVPADNQAFLYEMSEDAVLLNNEGQLIRHATSQLQGVAALGSPLCPIPQFVTVRGDECTVIATGIDDVHLVVDPSSGGLVPTSGALRGTYAVLVQLDNAIDSPEFPVQTGTFSGVITFEPPLPLGFVSGGTFTIDGAADRLPFKAVFRQPFTKSATGHVGKTVSRSDPSARRAAAYYLLDNGRLEKVRPDERAVGWPTVRFEITF